MGEPAMLYLARHDEPDQFPGPAVLDHLQRLSLNSGRVLLLIGALLVVSTVGNPRADTVRALLGLLLFLLGISLVMLSQVANQLPGAAPVGAAMSNAVGLNQSVAPGN